MPERRRQKRGSTHKTESLYVAVERADGKLRTRKAKLVDVSEWGIGFETSSPMVVGAYLLVWSPLLRVAPDETRRQRVQVVHCLLTDSGDFRAGCCFEDNPKAAPSEGRKPDASFTDHYEALQISPSADSETIHRVYRFLAQRYHPDNQDTGDPAVFQGVLQAYQILSDPERRAAYDAQRQSGQSLRWQVFETPPDAQDIEAETRIRAGLLAVLYAKRLRDPDAGGVMVRDFEEMLGCPREHLAFTMWYLSRKNWILGPTQGRYEITCEGVDAAEQFQKDGFIPKAAVWKQLPAANGSTKDWADDESHASETPDEEPVAAG